MENLEQALSFANYQGTLTRQRKLIAQKFQEETVMAYNGGLFKITPELLAGVQELQSNWILDSNGNPIKVDDLTDFIDKAKDLYDTAITNYGTEFSALRLKRNVKSLVDL
jgi:hypothetical protein